MSKVLARFLYDAEHSMAASHFFVGMGAGVAMLSIPVITLGGDLPQRVVAWIEAPAPQILPARTDNAAASRPERGYRPGDPTPAPDAAPPTVAPVAAKATATPAPAVQVAISTPQAPQGAVRTGVIRGNGAPVHVRRAAGVQSADDPVLADGSPVLVSAGSALQLGVEAWRAVRGLNGVAGWVPSGQVAVDGEPPPPGPIAVAGTQATPAVPRPSPTSERARIAKTGGVGVVLRNSPNDADRSRSGLADGATVSVLERSGADWVHVRADSGRQGWVPTRYVEAVG
jgi:SH3-like domain-containing protein